MLANAISIDYVINEINDELCDASAKHGKFASAHEGYAIILEELDELWDIVKLKPRLRDHAAMRKEAIQVAAMAARFVVDLLEE